MNRADDVEEDVGRSTTNQIESVDPTEAGVKMDVVILKGVRKTNGANASEGARFVGSRGSVVVLEDRKRQCFVGIAGWEGNVKAGFAGATVPNGGGFGESDEVIKGDGHVDAMGKEAETKMIGKWTERCKMTVQWDRNWRGMRCMCVRG